MSVTYTIVLSDAENKALAYAAVSPEEWINNVVKERCRIAMEEIVAAEVKRKLDIGESITGTRDDVVMSAPVLTAAERHAAAVSSDL
jgi:hypothetical protein